MRLAMFALLATLAGCGGAMRPIDSIPQGAIVSVDGEVVGKTPCQVPVGTVWFPKHAIRVELPGYSIETRQIIMEFDPTTPRGRFPSSFFVRLARIESPPQ